MPPKKLKMHQMHSWPRLPTDLFESSQCSLTSLWISEGCFVVGQERGRERMREKKGECKEGRGIYYPKTCVCMCIFYFCCVSLIKVDDINS